jgi:heme oxygenase
LLSQRVREQTATVHTEAEETDLMRQLAAGELPLSEYGRLLAQLQYVYAAIDAGALRWADDERVGGFFDPRLRRVEAIERDLVALGVSPQPPLPATQEYAARVDLVAAESPLGLVAHHYTRYLGDLSGGRVLAARLKTAYGLAPGAGLDFFEFEVGPVPPYKQRYRERLDALCRDDAEESEFVDEVFRAFSLNTGVFRDLQCA